MLGNSLEELKSELLRLGNWTERSLLRASRVEPGGKPGLAGPFLLSMPSARSFNLMASRPRTK